MAVSKHQRLLEILENRFDEPELRKIGFFLLGTGGYDNLRGKAKADRALSLIETLVFRNRINDLIAYIREFRPDITLDDFEDEIAGKAHAQVEFVNRVSEIQYITNPFCSPYLLLSAPAGYGKSKLLEVLRTQFQQQGWLCVYVKLTRGQPCSIEGLTLNILQEIVGKKPADLDLESPKDCGFEIACCVLEHLKKFQANGILLLLDEVETLGSETVKQALNEVIPALNEGLRTAGHFDLLRVILAGRYIAEWERLTHKVPLAVISLTPFSFPVVQQTVTSFAVNAGLTLAPESRQAIASHLMHLTGGHPGCMAEIMKSYRPGLPADTFLLGPRGDQHWRRVIQPVVDEIREYVPDPLRDILDTLSVVRRFSSRLLRHFIDTKLIRWSKSEHELEDALTQTYLVTREGGFLYDGITRRLLAVHLCRTDPDHFVNTCEEALVFYEHNLQDPGATRPDIIAIEFLFQKLQYLFYSKQLSGKEQIFEILPVILQKLTSGRDHREIMQSFTDLMRKDWELQFNFNYLLRRGVYDHESPYTELIQRIGYFEQGLQGGNNA